MHRLIILLLLIVNSATADAQINVDSLKDLVHRDKRNDTTLVIRLVLISIPYNFNNPDSGIYFGNQALQLARKLNYVRGEAHAYNSLQHAYLILGNYSQSMDCALESRPLFSRT